MEVEDDHYNILGLPSGEEGAKLSVKEIEKAYCNQAIRCHPHKNPDDHFTKSTFQKLQASYEILKNETTRKIFDDFLRAKIDRLRQENEFNAKRRRMMSELEKKEHAKQKAKEEEQMAAKKLQVELERIRTMHAHKMGEPPVDAGAAQLMEETPQPPSMDAATAVAEPMEETSQSSTVDKAVAAAEPMEETPQSSSLDTSASAAALPEPMEETPQQPWPPPSQENGGDNMGLYKEKILDVSWEKDGDDYSLERLKELFGRYGGVEDIMIRRGSMGRRKGLVVMVSKTAAIAASQGAWKDLPNPLSVDLLHPPVVVDSQSSEQDKMFPTQESGWNSTTLYKEKIVDVSWEKDGEDYNLERLKELFGRYGGVEDIVIRRASVGRRKALVVMVSKSAAVAASEGTWGHLPNPPYVSLLHPPVVMGSQSSEQNKMLPPPMRRFQSREELLEHVRSVGNAQGYIVTIKRSKKERYPYVTLGCDRGHLGHHKQKIPEDQRRRKKVSRDINCPFEMEGKKMKDGSWILKIRNSEHNHEPLEDASEHPFNRRFSEEEVSKIKEMVAAGLQPRKMLSTLWQRNPKVLSRDVYNIKAKIRLENLSGRTPQQALLDELSNVGFQYNLKCDEDGLASHFFFLHPDLITMSKRYSNIFVMDCTCKTKTYKMRLLSVVGITSFNTSFYSCFALLGKEELEDYTWALEMFDSMLGDCQPNVILSNTELPLMRAINVVFPGAVNLFSLWHVERSIFTNCKPYFKGGDIWDKFLSTWIALVDSPSEVAYYEAWQAFEAEFREVKDAVNFIANAFLPFKEYFVKPWTDKHLHFGNRISSKAQGTHLKLKKFFKASFLSADKSRMKLDIENQYQKTQSRLSADKLKVNPKFCIPFFSEVIGHVSVFALRQLFKQYKLATSNPTLSICTNQFTATMGLPCAHKMRYRMGESEVLHISDIHSQWLIDGQTFNHVDNGVNSDEDQPSNMPMLDKPDVQHPIRPPPRPKNPKPVRKLPEDPLGTEIVQRIRKCGLCKGTGHNSRTCQQKSEAARSGSESPFFYKDGNPLGIGNLNASCDGSGGFVSNNEFSVIGRPC